MICTWHRLTVLWVIFIASPCIAQQIAAPLGLELGKATCGQASSKLGLGSAPSKETSSWAKGSVWEINDAARANVDGLKRAVFVCDDKEKLLVVALTFSKGGMSQEALQRTATQLDSKYQRIRRNLPQLGNGSAEWKAANATIEIESPHLSFDFEILYWAPGAKAMFTAWNVEQRSQRDKKKVGNL